MRILSLDVGRNKTGVAISENTLGLVTPLKPLFFPINSSVDKWWEKLNEILSYKFYDLEEIDTVVIGSWKDAEYKNREMKHLVKKVAEIIKEKTNWKIHFIREAYTSVESREILRAMGVKEKKIYRTVDSYAASLLLIDYLELVKPFRG